MRKAEIERNTRETQIVLKLNLDGTGESSVRTGCGFLDHMLELFAKHGNFDLAVTCQGDTNVDFHHTVEDVGICLGKAFLQALGDKRGLVRYGCFALPMDETLILTAVDFGGRSFLNYGLQVRCPRLGDFDTELVEEFLLGFTREAKCNLHVKQLDGKNLHHIFEGTFKSMARAMRQAVRIEAGAEDRLPTTKGVLE